jgi:hypothetical protein
MTDRPSYTLRNEAGELVTFYADPLDGKIYIPAGHYTIPQDQQPLTLDKLDRLEGETP